MGGRIQSLQVLRFLAAAMVIVAHATEAFGGPLKGTPLAEAGAAGLDLFFVLSGFIITRVAAETPGAVDFLKRRYLRVAPLFYLSCIPWIFISLGDPLLRDWILASLTFWPVQGGQIVGPVNNVGWTLCFEMVFYAAVGLSKVHRWAGWAILGLYALAALLAAPERPALGFLGNAMFLEFLAGAAIAIIWKGRASPVFGAILTAAGALAMLAGAAATGPAMWTSGMVTAGGVVAAGRTAALGAPAALIVLGFLHLEPWLRGQRLLGYLGDASYSIYLTHTITITVFGRLLGASSPGMFAASIPLAVVIGVLTHEIVEKPLLRALRRPRLRAQLEPAV